MMAIKKVYSAIAAITAELAEQGIPKERSNHQDGYKFRGIDDIYNALSPLLARHKLCILPRILERTCEQRRSTSGESLAHVTLRAAFDFVSAEDGSKHMVETWGEAMDASDKATAKAMSAAYKYAAMQTFCIPTDSDHDSEASSPRPKAIAEADLPPPNGWEAWATDLQAVANNCLTEEALARLQATYRDRLRALSKAEPKLYASVGETIRSRRAALTRSIPKREAA